MRLRDERGVTLIELLVAMTITMVILGSVVFLLTAFFKDNTYANYRDDAQANAQVMVDRISRELRTAAAPSVGSLGLLGSGDALPYDLAFESVSATGTGPSGNAANQIWVRYCLGASNTLWRQSTTPATTTATLPDTTACPSVNSAWVQTGSSPCCQELNDVTNEIGGDTTRPLFTYGPTGWSDPNKINQVEVSMYVDKNPGQQPGPTQLTSGIDLRNQLGQPVALFTASQTAVSSTVRDVVLNGSASSDPNGQALTYQWYNGGTCPSPSGLISGATTQQYDAGDFSTTGPVQNFSLVITSSAGLTACSSQSVTIQ